MRHRRMYEGEINMVIHVRAAASITGGHSPGSDRHGPDRAWAWHPGDVELAMQEGYSTAPDQIRSLGFGAGMGLPNMKKYSDEMEIFSTVGEGTTVHMVVNF